MPIKIVSVSQLNQYLKEKLDQDRLLRNIWVKGEISNFKHHSSGHMYFTLKDAQSGVKAVMFKGYSASLPFKPASGMSVIARGNISMFLRDGQYQLYVEELQPEGYGAISLAFEQLKAKLEGEGLFAPQHKKQLPLLPKRVGIVTSPTGAALRDILTVLLRRFPQAQVIISPTQVQGDTAPAQIAAALTILQSVPEVDVIIVSRGGGSLEELWAFNDENLARAIHACRTPVITGIGHETDFTIADFVADVRAATPSAAAELAVPAKRELERLLNQHLGRLNYNIASRVKGAKERLLYLANKQVLREPLTLVNQRRQRIDQVEDQLQEVVKAGLTNNRHQLGLLAEKLNLLSPLGVLARGYSICRQPGEGQVISSGSQLEPGQQVEVLLRKDQLLCEVLEVKEVIKNESGD